MSKMAHANEWERIAMTSVKWNVILNIDFWS